MIRAQDLKIGFKGIFISTLLGLTAVFVHEIVDWPVLDPLIVALLLGIAVRSFLKIDRNWAKGFDLAPSLFIPIGVIFYGIVNLRFEQFVKVDTNYIFMVFMVFIVYIISSLMLAYFFKLKEKKGYLIASGSTICGASAITITSKSIDANADEVSVSMIAVFIAGLLALFVFLPLIRNIFNLTNLEFSVFSGTVLQFTGFVKASVADLSPELNSLAVSVKGFRYLGLLFIIPLFASFVKGRFSMPWYLWIFLGAGLMVSFMPGWPQALRPAFKPVLNIFWSIALAAIGLNANVKKIFSSVGLKAIAVSLLAFIIASVVFFLGLIFVARDFIT